MSGYQEKTQKAMTALATAIKTHQKFGVVIVDEEENLNRVFFSSPDDLKELTKIFVRCFMDCEDNPPATDEQVVADLLREVDLDDTEHGPH